jgi:UDP-N-acetylmuramoyl-tripeptide--D-alanyl-D-alanine ligase
MHVAFIAILLLSMIIALIWSISRCILSLHLLQLDSYSNMRLLKWLWFSPFERLFDYRLGGALLLIIGLHLILRWFNIAYGYFISPASWVMVGSLLFLRRKKPEAKKPLVYTPRAKRILGVAVSICVAIAAIFSLWALKELPSGIGGYQSGTIVLAGSLIITQLASLIVLVSNFLLAPVQSAINMGYVRSAKTKLKEIKPVVMGVAGSYGKTSTKYILEIILAERFLVLKTPKSFNTLMGLCRVINDDLKPEHQIFIAEMGAYRRGDVRELADLVSPQIGIITSIGPEHFERFKSIENIKATNYELIEALPKSGVAVFNNDIEECRELADRTKTVKVLRYGLDRSQTNLRVWAEDINMNPKGLTFTLADSDGNRARTQVGLLGRHNVLNILGAACIALEMGMSLEDIAQAIPKIKQVPHRLQLIPGAAGVTVIDDSYNSNPIGAIEALNVLGEFKTGKRVLVTPGMVELGVLESKENERFGAAAAKICDYVFLVGAKQTQPILRGLEREQFPQERLRVVKDLSEATAELQKIVRNGDTVLFENDLPDLYAGT